MAPFPASGNVPLRLCGASRRSWFQALAWSARFGPLVQVIDLVAEIQGEADQLFNGKRSRDFVVHQRLYFRGHLWVGAVDDPANLEARLVGACVHWIADGRDRLDFLARHREVRNLADP